MQLSVAVTTFNRFELTIKAIEQLLDDPRIADFQILDDKSTDGSFERLSERFYDTPRVYVRQQKENVGMSLNKKDAVALAQSDWVLLADSDNVFDKSYLDALEKVGELKEDTIYMPNAALPKFVFSVFDGLDFNKETAKDYLSDPMFRVSLNTANYVVNRDFYVKVYRHNPKHLASDTIWHNYRHLKAGGNFYIVPGMNYLHLTHSGSAFLKDLDINMANAEEVKNLIGNL